ncbi:MAG: S9 family peptidase [Leptolyngbyaceae cyanobacterium MO_188.B28]|nr:S9 family peptidase [Leptolyngbyaceae cyanobacterium MO_188.B28]
MTDPKLAPYGSWKSPITPKLIAAATIRLGSVRLDGQDIYWKELRPMEKGRSVVVRKPAKGKPLDVTSVDYNVRTRVHEYGGGDFIVANGTLYFSNFRDQRLYYQRAGNAAQPLTPEENYRYADCVLDQSQNRLICVREDHTAADQEAVNTLVGIGLNASTPAPNSSEVLAAGHDFYASPRLSPEGSQLAWLSWNHPNMPWDSAELWVAPIKADGTLGEHQRIAGGGSESIFQPEWSPDGRLYFISDRTNWWNLYCWDGAQIHPLCPKEAEFGAPQWGFAMSTYGFESSHALICTYSEHGRQQLARLDTKTQSLSPIETPYSSISGLKVGAGYAVFMGGSPQVCSEIACLNLATNRMEVLRRASEINLDPGYLSSPEPIEFPTANGLTAHAFYYPPHNRDYQAPSKERPPLLVKSHGGPTAATSTILNLGIQYWTSRGIAVLDVNYGGSTGYGRAYRQRLQGQWGIVDVEDCINGAQYLVNQDKVDGDRLAISGGSAGGYTTLAALTFHDVFKAGASYYGVSDLEALTRDTHKFESRYLDSLIGPYPDQQPLYQARSPINHLDQLACPIIFFQGDGDKVVPPNQAEKMVEALKSKQLPVAYLLFEGEQHGFRQAENIKRALEAELYFYAQVFGFAIADPIAPVAIANLS